MVNQCLQTPTIFVEFMFLRMCSTAFLPKPENFPKVKIGSFFVIMQLPITTHNFGNNPLSIRNSINISVVSAQNLAETSYSKKRYKTSERFKLYFFTIVFNESLFILGYNNNEL